MLTPSQTSLRRAASSSPLPTTSVTWMPPTIACRTNRSYYYPHNYCQYSFWYSTRTKNSNGSSRVQGLALRFPCFPSFRSSFSDLSKDGWSKRQVRAGEPALAWVGLHQSWHSRFPYHTHYGTATLGKAVVRGSWCRDAVDRRSRQVLLFLSLRSEAVLAIFFCSKSSSFCSESS